MNNLSTSAHAWLSACYNSFSQPPQDVQDKPETSSLRTWITKCFDNIQPNDELELSKSIEEVFKKDQGKELKQIFDEVKLDKSKFNKLACLFAYCAPYSIAFICNFLDSLDWPGESDKQKELKNLVLFMLNGGLKRGQALKVSSNFVALNKTESVPITQVIVDFRVLIGKGDFIQDPVDMPTYLYSVLGTMLMFIDLKEDSSGDSKKEWQGVGITLGQFRECRFPAKLISPFLPYLAQIDKLVKVDLSDIGHQMDPHIFYNSTGFSDVDAQALYTILENNPCLVDFTVNNGGMSNKEKTKMYETVACKLKEHKEHFWESVKILNEKQNKSPSIQQVYDSMVKG